MECEHHGFKRKIICSTVLPHADGGSLPIFSDASTAHHTWEKRKSAALLNPDFSLRLIPHVLPSFEIQHCWKSCLCKRGQWKHLWDWIRKHSRCFLPLNVMRRGSHVMLGGYHGFLKYWMMSFLLSWQCFASDPRAEKYYWQTFRWISKLCELVVRFGKDWLEYSEKWQNGKYICQLPKITWHMCGKLDLLYKCLKIALLLIHA